MANKFKPQNVRLQYILRALMRKNDRFTAKSMQERLKQLAEDMHLDPADPLYNALVVDVRTIKRDLKYLHDAFGARIKWNGSLGSYVMRGNVQNLPTVLLDDSFLYALAIAEKALGQHRKVKVVREVAEKFREIRELFPEDSTLRRRTAWESFSFFHPLPVEVKDEVWDPVKNGLDFERTVRIAYSRVGSRKPFTRDVDPYHLANHNGIWYLFGRDHCAGEIRTFALHRIDSAEVLPGEFDVPLEFEFEEYMGSHFGVFRGDEEHHVRLRFHKGHAAHALERDWHPTVEKKRLPDGRAEISLRVNDLKEITRWILSWGAGIEVLEPALLRRIVRENAEDVVERNEEDE